MFRRSHKLLMLFYSMSNQVENVVNQLEEVIDKIVNKKGEVGVLHVVDQLTQVIQEIQQKSEGDDQATSVVKKAPSVGKPTPSSQPTSSVGKKATSVVKQAPSVVKQAPSVGTPTSSDQPTPIVGPGEVVIITSRTENSPNELNKDGKVGDTKIVNTQSIQLS